MKRLTLLPVTLAFLCAACASQQTKLPVFDRSAFKFNSVEISFTEPQGIYLNRRTIEAVRREGAYKLVSSIPSYISQLYAGLDLSSAAPCRHLLKDDIYLVVDFISREKTETWVSDGTILSSEDGSLCIDSVEGLLGIFDLAMQLSDRSR